jgi:tetratricopeptide (TPR) repeat protein/transcriptional regulator with XRE-family HTH domain
VPVPPEAFGAALRRLRERVGLTQEQLAERAGLSTRAIRGLERGERLHPYPHTIRALASALGLSVEEQTKLTASLSSRRRRMPATDLHEPTSSLAVDPGQLARAEEAFASMPTDTLPAHSVLALGSQMALAPNPLFVGRRGELLQLARAIRGDTTTPGLGQVIVSTGLGGLGKTQLAVEFAHRYGRFFAGGVYWVSFASADEIPLQIASCAGPGLDARPLEERVRRVTLAWQSAVPRLLVFDNCEDESLLEAWRPSSGACKVLVTSRRSEWSPTLGVTVLPLDLLPRADSIELLRRYRPALAPDDTVLDAVAAEVGDLPLALHLAGSYLRAYRAEVSLDDYLIELRLESVVRHASLLGAVLDDSPSPTRHVQSVAQTFALCLGRLDRDRDADRVAIALLARMAWMAPGVPVPRDLLARTIEELNPRRFSDALRRLSGVGLVQESDGWLRLHRLLAHFARQQIPESNARLDVDRALTAYAADAGRGRLSGMALAAVIPHLYEMTTSEVTTESEGLRGKRSQSRQAHGHFQLGVAMVRQVRPQDAIEHLREARSLFDALDDPWMAAESLEWEAGARYMQDDPGALAMAEEALRLYRRLDLRAVEVESRMLEHLGTILAHNRSFLRARECYNEALELGGPHLDAVRLARIYHGLGTCYGQLGDPQQAIELTSQAVMLYSAENEAQHRQVFGDQPRAEGDLGFWYMRVGNLEQAEELLMSALDHLAEQGIERLRSRALMGLSELRQAQGRHDEAFNLASEAIDLATRYDEQTTVAAAYQQMGQIHMEHGASVYAGDSFERALAIRERVLGPDHPDTVETKRALAELAAEGDG